MSDELFCAKCGGNFDEMLILSCEHNLCIQCAAENISRMEPQGINKSVTIICDFCKSQTEIDNQTCKDILLASNGQLQSSNNNFASNAFDNTFNVSSYSKYPSSNYREVCAEHGEPISYLCFDCLSKCICSECVVHGVHRNHEVINIKKAYPLICDKASELIAHVDSKVKDLSNTENALELRKGEMTSIGEKCKREIKAAFDELRFKIAKKEKELIDRCELQLNEKLQEMNTYSRIIQSKIISMNKIIDSIQAHLMRKDELMLINFYCENKNKILSGCEISELKLEGLVNNLPATNMEVERREIENLGNMILGLKFEDIINRRDSMNNRDSYVVRRNLYGIGATGSSGINKTFDFSSSSKKI